MSTYTSIRLRVASAVRSSPRLCNALVAGFCASTGDFITQSSSGDGPLDFDARRNLAYTAFGMAWTVPGRIFYAFLAKHVPSNTLASAVKGALIGELAVDLPITNPAFMLSTDILRGRDLKFAAEHLRRDYLDCATLSFCIWFPSTVLNLRVIPLQYRVIFDNIMTVLWSATFSLLTNRR